MGDMDQHIYCILGDPMSCLQYCFACAKFCKASYLGCYSTKTIIWLLVLEKIHICCVAFSFGWREIQKCEDWFFPFRELRHFHITLYKDCDGNLVKFTTFYQTRSV